eukprot:7241099-Heterocapsa_arctica.AAC.1
MHLSLDEDCNKHQHMYLQDHHQSAFKQVPNLLLHMLVSSQHRPQIAWPNRANDEHIVVQ